MIKISEPSTIKIQLNHTKVKVPSEIVGIDIGQSLTKIAYMKENELILTLTQTDAKFSDVTELKKVVLVKVRQRWNL